MLLSCTKNSFYCYRPKIRDDGDESDISSSIKEVPSTAKRHKTPTMRRSHTTITEWGSC